MPGRYTIQIKRSAVKALQGLPGHTQAQIRKQIDSLAENPRPVGAQALRGYRGFFRLRVGDYRIIYQVEDPRLLVLVVRIGHRREVYRNL